MPYFQTFRRITFCNFPDSCYIFDIRIEAKKYFLEVVYEKKLFTVSIINVNYSSAFTFM